MNKGKTPTAAYLNQSIHLTCISLALMQVGDFQRYSISNGNYQQRDFSKSFVCRWQQ